MLSPSADKIPNWEENLNRALVCPDCKENPPNLVEEFSSGDMVCGSCGLVLGDRIVDTRSEWRTFSNDDQGNDDPSRVGDAANPLLNGSQLQTTIQYGDGMGGRARDLARAQNKQSENKKDKGLMAAYKEIGALCDAISIPKNICDSAKHIYKTVDDAKAFKGKSIDSLIATCIFIACRSANVGRSFKEIHALTQVPKKEIGRTYKLVSAFLNKQKSTKYKAGILSDLPDAGLATTSTSAKDLCLRFCSQLGLQGQQYVKISQGLAERLSNIENLAGRSPLSNAGACIYTACCLLGKPKTPKEISIVAGVSDGTIRTAYKILYAHREELIDPEWIAGGKGDMANLPVA